MNTKTKAILPSPTWRWLKVNNIDLPDLSESKGTVLNISDNDDYIVDEMAGSLIVSPKGKAVESVLKIGIHSGENDSLNKLNIRLGSGQECGIILDHTSEGRGVCSQFDLLCNVPEGAKLTVYLVQRMDRADTLVSDIDAQLMDNGCLEVIQVFTGGKDTFSSVHSILRGKASHFGLRSAYLLEEGQNLDINYVADHFGKKTTCDMTTLGVMYKGSQKVYRGTIDFKRGCKDAVGSETEDVLLMDEDVINKSVPVILCSEEDVEGNHGATIGKISDDMLFYMTSRGIDPDEIYDMLAKSRVESVASMIPDEDLREALIGKL